MPQTKTPQKDPFADYQQPATSDPFANYQEASPVAVVPVKTLQPLDYQAPGQGRPLMGDPNAAPYPQGGFGDVVMRPVENTVRAGAKRLQTLPGRIEQGVERIPQYFQDFAEPKNAVRRMAGIEMSPDVPRETATEWPKSTANLNLDKNLPELVGSGGIDLGLAELGVQGFSKLRPSSLFPKSESISSQEAAARELAKGLAVPELDVKNFVRAAADEAGTIRHYAAQNGLPINSTLDFANAAKAAKTATADFYENNILKPVENKSVSVGPKPQDKMTLRDIDSRIVQINKELNPAYRQKLQSQTGHMLASEADLLAEQKKLNTILNRELGQSAGVPPETVSEIRTKLGKLGTVADIAESSANRDLAAAGKAARGESSGIGGKENILHKGYQKMRGGPVVIGNKATLKALENVQPQPLILPRLAPTQEEMLSSEALRAHRNTVRQQRGLPPL